MSGAIGKLAIGQTPIGGSFVQAYTANDLVMLTLKNASLVGTGQTPNPEDVTDVFNLLNGMLAIWSRRRWLVWHLLDISVPTTTSGKRVFTIGPGGDFDFPRPDRLEGAYFRQFVQAGGQPVDFQLGLLQSMEDYASVTLKFLTSWPQAVFYDSAVPLGQIYPVPIPNVANSELHVLIKDTLNQFPSLTTPFNLPPEYFEAIWSNLALRVAAAFPGANVNEFTIGIAKASLATIRGANAQIPRLQMPRGLGRGLPYNIYSGPGQPI